MVTTNLSIQKLVEEGRVESEQAVVVSLSRMNWSRHDADAADQAPMNTRAINTKLRPANSPTMARRPFQISAWGVNPRFQELSSSAPTGTGLLEGPWDDSAITLMA